jgi:hypothetical protein
LRCEAQRTALVRVVQRLDPVGIAREQQLLFRRVPQPKSVHAAQRVEHFHAAVAIQVQEHLGIGAGAKDVTAFLQLAAQRSVVVDLAVERHRQPTIRGLHRLRRAIGEIDDRETPVT